MNLRSKGLGKTSLNLDLEKAKLSTVIASDPNDNRFVFSGIIEGNKEAYAPFGKLSERYLRAWLDGCRPNGNI